MSAAVPTQQPPSAPRRHAALTERDATVLRVLTDPILFTQVVGWMRGIPFLLLDLAKTLPMDSWSSLHGDRALVARTAIQRDDRRVLRMLFEMHASVADEDHSIETLDVDNVLFWAIKIGRVEMLSWLIGTFSNCLDTSVKLLDVAIIRGDVDILELVHNRFHDQFDRDEVSSCALSLAPKAQQLVVAKWLHRHEYAACFSSYVVERVIEGGDVEMLQFLHENCSRNFPSHAMHIAALGGNFGAVQILNARPDPRTTRAMDAAAQNGHLEVVRFLHETRREACTAFAMDRAACNGFLDVVQFLHENRTEGCTKDALNGAARYGYLDVVKFLVEHRREGIMEEAMQRAESQGHVEVAAYLREKIEARQQL
ncbi:Ankyrin-like protein, partial [Globisporangium splendens]